MNLRPVIAHGAEPMAARTEGAARVCLAAGAAGPIGGDQLSLDIVVGAGSALVLTEASATVLLPGRYDDTPSQTHVRVAVEEGGTFVWLPEPLIASRGCRHVNDVAVDLAGDARLLLREQVLLGRKHEVSGRLLQRLRVSRGGRPLLAQDLDLGGDAARSPAVVGKHRAVGSLLAVGTRVALDGPVFLPGDGVLLPLAATGAVLAHALAPDSGALYHQLSQALAVLASLWGPDPGRGS